MALINKSLGYLYRAVSGSARTSQAVSIGGLAGGGTNVSFSSFGFDSASVALPYTYIVEGTSENIVWSFTSAGTRFDSKVKDVNNNYGMTISPNDGAFSYGTNAAGTDGVKASSTKLAVTNITNGVYAGGTTGYTISTTYNDGGWSQYQDGFNRTSGKTFYTVDSYNSINADVLCVDINTPILLANGSTVSAGDLYVGDTIKTYVPTDMPEWMPDNDPENWYWWYQTGSSGEIVDATVSNVYYSFIETYMSINDGSIKCTKAHPLFIHDLESGTYQFVRAEDITIGDKLIKYNSTTSEMEEIDVVNIETINETLEIATITVDAAHTFLTNGYVSHNKGSSTYAPIPSANLVMYLDPERAASYSAQGQQVWFDLTGKGTGLDVKSGAASPSGDGSYSVAPTFNNTTPKSLTFPGGAVNYSGGRKLSTMANGTGLSYFATPSTGATFIWWQNGATGSGSNFFLLQGTGGIYYVSSYGASSPAGLQMGWPGESGPQFISNTSMTVTGWNMYVMRWGSDGVWVYQNNNAIATNLGSLYGNVNAAITSPTKVSMNGTDAGMVLGPCLFYNAPLSTTEMSQIWNNLRGRFGK